MPADEPHIDSLSAVTLAVTDMDASVAFYRSLGFTSIAYGGAGHPFTTFEVGGGFLNLQLVERVEHGIWGRAIFHVADVDAVHEAALRAGLTPEFPPRDADWGERYFHVRDPDGHEISFARPLDH